MPAPVLSHDPLLAASAGDSTPASMVAGALAHLATHMQTGCPRAAYLASMLLDRIANDVEADDHLRRHARQLVDVLETESGEPPRGTIRIARATAAAASMARSAAIP